MRRIISMFILLFCLNFLVIADEVLRVSISEVAVLSRGFTQGEVISVLYKGKVYKACVISNTEIDIDFKPNQN